MHYGAYRCQRVNKKKKIRNDNRNDTSRVEREKKKMNSMNVVIRQLALFITIFSDVGCNSVFRSTEICDDHIYHMRPHWVSFVEANLPSFFIYFSCWWWWCGDVVLHKLLQFNRSVKRQLFMCAVCVCVSDSLNKSSLNSKQRNAHSFFASFHIYRNIVNDRLVKFVFFFSVS